MRVRWVLPCVMVVIAGCSGGDDSSDDDASTPDDDAADDGSDDDADDEADDDTWPPLPDDDLDMPDLAIDASQIDGELNRRLNGGHYHDERPTEGELALEPTFRRRVASSANHMHWDCDTQSFAPETLIEYHDWLDLLQDEGIEPMIALAYVPECMSENGHPKAPPLVTQAAAYETYIRSFFQEFVSGRIEAGKAPLRYFEVWNEPDPLNPFAATSDGNGFVGTLDEFEERVFVPLGNAVMDEEADSGVDIEFGVAACAIPRPLGDEFASLEEFLIVAGFDPGWAAFFGPLGEGLADVFYPWGGFAGLWDSGGFDWPDRLTATGEAEGIDVDFVSWHHYIDTPFEGPGPGCAVPDAVWFLHQRNPVANVNEYLVDALDYRERYPGKDLYLTEWGISFGCQSRAAYEIGAFHAATLIALQQGGMDGAMALYLPGEGPEAMAHWMFTWMADHLVAQSLGEDGAETGVWTLASVDGEEPTRFTLFAAQWHSLKADSSPRDLDVSVANLPPGTWRAAVHRIDSDHEGSTEPDEVYYVVAQAGAETDLTVPLDRISATYLELTRP